MPKPSLINFKALKAKVYRFILTRKDRANIPCLRLLSRQNIYVMDVFVKTMICLMFFAANSNIITGPTFGAMSKKDAGIEPAL